LVQVAVAVMELPHMAEQVAVVALVAIKLLLVLLLLLDNKFLSLWGQVVLVDQLVAHLF
jgi:hypothetical protein